MITNKDIECTEKILTEIEILANRLEFDELEKRQANKLQKAFILIKEVQTNLKEKL